MMDTHNNLQVGSSVNIKRTDGRIHSAVVSSINFESRSATVEWFEHDETKGKEIDLDVIETLNPDIKIMLPIDKQNHHEPIITSQTSSNILQRDSCGSSEEETSALMAQSGRFTHKLDESDDDFNSNQFSSDTTTLSNPTRQSVVSNIRPNNGYAKSRISHAVLNQAILQPSTSQSGSLHLGTSQVIPQPSSSYVHSPQPGTSQYSTVNNGYTNSETITTKESNVPTNRLSSQNLRKTNVVKEVEKLRKNREERRKQQAEEKAEKEAFLQLAPGNPHWELLNMIGEYRKGLDIKPLTENDVIEDHLITVCVRKRPLNKKEMSKKEVDVITVPSKNQLIVHEPKNKVDLTKYLENQLFRFDYAFDETSTNELVYKYTAQPLIKTIFEGGFATCFAYGQTGSGKTHTMGGDINGKNQNYQKGIYAMAAADVFKFSKLPTYRHLDLVVSASFFEIYSGKVFDLLNNKIKLRILEDGKQQVQVVGLTERVVSSTDEVLKLIQKGNQARTSGKTFANSNSSRSHAIFQIYLRSKSHMQKIYGKFSLIDLAGNERGADTSSANRQTRMEGAEINKSLLALKECIRALGRRGAHLPFRVSKLTLVLRDSFVGSNSRTCMIAMVSPNVNSCEHTLNTLRYADRVKELGAGDLQTISTDNNSHDDQEDQDDQQDLLQLRSLNENDMSQELLRFHQVIFELQDAEEKMIDNHKQLLEEMKTNCKKLDELLKMTDGITYDQEVYCKNLAELINNSMESLLRAREIVDSYKSKLAAEEQLSRKIKRN